MKKTIARKTPALTRAANRIIPYVSYSSADGHEIKYDVNFTDAVIDENNILRFYIKLNLLSNQRLMFSTYVLKQHISQILTNNLSSFYDDLNVKNISIKLVI